MVEGRRRFRSPVVVQNGSPMAGRRAAARRRSPAPRTPIRRAGWCRCCGPAGCPIRGASPRSAAISISLAKRMVSPASTGLIQRSSRKPGDGPQTATSSPRAAASFGLALAVGDQQLHADRSDMPARRRKPAEQRLAALLLVEMKALRIELRGEFLDHLGGEGERSDFAPLPDLDFLEETHQPAYSAAPARRRTMIGETISHSASPPALRTTPLNVTMPVSGRLLRNPAPPSTSTSSSEIVARPQRRQPAQFVDAGRAQRCGAADKAVEHHPHHDRAEMPARTRKPLQHRACRGLFVEMHRLRIELRGKGEHLLARDVARAECAETAGRKIFEGQCHGWGLPEGSPIVAVICGNLNPPARMARALRASTAFGARPDLARDDIRS